MATSQMDSKLIFVVIGVTALTFGSSEAFTCYDCNSGDDKKCISPSKSDGIKTCEGEVCTKFMLHKPDGMLFWRSCSPDRPDGKVGCEDAPLSVEGFNQSVCACKADYCNDGQLIKLSMNTIIVVLAMSWALAFENIPEFKEINKTYQDLRNKNVDFPPIDPDKLLELNIPVKATESSGATDLLLPEGGQMHSRVLLPTGAGSQTSRRSSAGVIRSGLSPTGMNFQQVRRPSAVIVQSYLLAGGTEFQNSRRSSAASVQSMRRVSAEMIHHSCLSPTGTDSEKTRRRPSADLFHARSLAPGGTDNEKNRRRNSRDIVHNSCLSPAGTDSEKSRRRPSTDMVQLSCLSPTGTDSDQTRRRLSVQTQSRRASMENLYRRFSLQSQFRRPSFENQNRLPPVQNRSTPRSSEGNLVSSISSARTGVEQPLTAVGHKGHPTDQLANVSTKKAGADSGVGNLVDLGRGSSSQTPVFITKQLVDISLDGRSVKASDPCSPCIVVTTVDEEVIFDHE